MADETNLHRSLLHPASEPGAAPPPHPQRGASEPPVPREVAGEALDVLDDALAGFASELAPDELDDAREFLLDLLAAHPLGHLLGERLREPAPPAYTEERDQLRTGDSTIPEEHDEKKARGTG